jgi:hypothetical protein
MVFQGCSLVDLPHPVCLVNGAVGKNAGCWGCNHANIELRCHEEYVIPAGIHAVYNIVQSCFRIKANKFENYYEQFLPIRCPEKYKWNDPDGMHALSLVVAFRFSDWIARPLIARGC